MQEEVYKALVFDVDHSLSTIGGKDKQTKVFGLPAVPWSGSAKMLRDKLMQNVIQITRVPEIHPIMGDVGSEVIITFNEKLREHGVNMMILDTVTMLGVQERAHLVKEQKLESMEMRTWGLYGDTMEKLFNLFSKCNFPVIVTGHVKRKEDEYGRPIEVPDLKGSIETACGRYFDVIAYSKVSKDAKNKTKTYSWIVSADSRYIFAKNRGDYLPSVIPQDISYIINCYKKNGVSNPKILILGDTGNGKSWSLQTINNNTQIINQE
jgi:hypothetical protein